MSPILAQLLIHRGITTESAAKRFFRPQLSDLINPFLMKDMDIAVDRLNDAMGRKERILIYGDYDVDGCTAVALVYKFLQQFYSNIDYYIPDRYDEGYGVSLKGIDFAHETGVKLIIILDCGIKAIKEIEYAKSLGIDFIICDHHVPDDVMPPAVAILNPKRPDDSYFVIKIIETSLYKVAVLVRIVNLTDNDDMRILRLQYSCSVCPEGRWHHFCHITAEAIYTLAAYEDSIRHHHEMVEMATYKDAWKEKVKLSPAANGVKSGTAYNSDNTTTPHAYTLAVGDIYYSDGAISHQEDALLKSTSKRFPIGIVGYTTMNEDGNYWTEKGVSGKDGHALVMCLKTIGSTGITSMGTTYPWYSSNSDVGRTKVNTRLLLVNSYKQSYGSGYTETNALIEIWGPDPAPGAAYQAKNYKTLPAPTNKCTGWFLPSAGQYYAVMTTLGAPFSDDWDDWPEIWDGYKPSNLEYGFFNNMTTVSGNINAALSKVGPDQYTEFFQGTNTWELTSSEFSPSSAVLIDSGIDERRGPGSFRFATTAAKVRPIAVRPFLAF